MARQDQNYLAIGHPLVVERIDLGQKLLDFFFATHHTHHAEQIFELHLADDTVLVVVYRLEQVCELDQEALVLLQLEIEHNLLEVCVL